MICISFYESRSRVANSLSCSYEFIIFWFSPLKFENTQSCSRDKKLIYTLDQLQYFLSEPIMSSAVCWRFILVIENLKEISSICILVEQGIQSAFSSQFIPETVIEEVVLAIINKCQVSNASLVHVNKSILYTRSSRVSVIPLKGKAFHCLLK